MTELERRLTDINGVRHDNLAIERDLITDFDEHGIPITLPGLITYTVDSEVLSEAAFFALFPHLK